jgi:hypothetical protein
MSALKIALCASAVIGMGSALHVPANGAEARLRLGTLSCHESSGWGFVFGSSRALHCTFSNGSHIEKYRGDISKFGVDIGYQSSGVLIWEVLSLSGRAAPDAIEGRYGGVTAGASVGVGLSANALIGGTSRDIALQPLSIEGTTGLNLAAGIGEMTLHAYKGT